MFVLSAGALSCNAFDREAIRINETRPSVFIFAFYGLFLFVSFSLSTPCFFFLLSSYFTAF